MKTEFSLNMENEFFKTELHDDLVVVEGKQNIFDSLLNIETNFDHLEWLKRVEKDENVKGILYLANKSSFCIQAYIDFLSLLTGENLSQKENRSIKKFVDHTARSKQINMIYNYITAFVNSSKIIFSLLDGCIVTPFVGLSMAADIRIGTKNTEFNFAHKKFGLHPSGALPFFLSRFLGHSKAQEILYTVDSLNAEQLIELDLIHTIVDDDINQKSIEYALGILKQEHSTLKSTKFLLRSTMLNHFDDYTETEKRIVMS